jgi:glycosyltransferase involved in cell wall biosynthesis
MVHTSEPSSGAARYVFELVKGLSGINAPVVLFCPSNFEYLRELETSGIDVFLSGARGVESATLTARVLRNLRFLSEAFWHQFRVTRRGDIVHFHFPIYFPFGLLLFLLAAAKNCPIVFTAHDPLPHKWLWPGRFRAIERRMLGWAYRLSRRIIVHNETGRGTLIREFQVDPDKLSLICHGPFSLPGCRESLPPFDEFRLLAFGSIRANKGIHLAIQAVQLLNARSGPRVHLTIAGSVANAREETYWSECKALIEKGAENIHVIEHHISDVEVAPLLGDHHALVLPYLDFSSESGVASLALSNRRPILATRAMGLGALLASCDCGVPIESPTVEGVAAAIAKALEGGRDMLERMGTEGERFVSSTRSWRQIGIQTLALYAQLFAAGQYRCLSKEAAARPQQDGGEVVE